jgi:UDPglucose 6-dehydrogenase
MIESVAVIGLGKLGSPIAACFASKGLHVIGVDRDTEKVRALDSGAPPVIETGLAEMMKSGAGRLTATRDLGEAVGRCDASFIIVPTPSHEDGSFSIDVVLGACEEVGRVLRGRAGHLVVITSTVNPGSTGGQIQSVLEEASGKRCGKEFGLCYSPEFIALGSVIEDFLSPDFVLIGESDSRSGDLLEDVYRRVCSNSPPIARMSFVNAEITKLAVNTFVTTKIGFANMLAEVCGRVPGGDVDAVTSALALDTRIGGLYLKGGLGYGGPCFPRDNRALSTFVRSVGVEPAIPEATDRANAVHFEHVLELVRSKQREGGTVAVLGLSYKPSTDVVEMSPGLELVRSLSAAGVSVRAHDPLARVGVLMHTSETVVVCESVLECVCDADVVVIATPWTSFADELPRAVAESKTAPVVIDCWRMIDAESLEPSAEYVGLGIAP